LPVIHIPRKKQTVETLTTFYNKFDNIVYTTQPQLAHTTSAANTDMQK